MPKPHTLDISPLYDVEGSGSKTCYYSKGHHDPQAFCAEALKEFEVIVKPEKIIHKYMRWEMYTGPDGPCHVGEEYLTTGRGKFPITIVYEWEDAEVDNA